MPAKKDSFQLQCDIPIKIKEFYKQKAKSQNVSVSAILNANFKSYLEDNGNWNLPENTIVFYEAFGDIGFNNLKFNVDQAYRDFVDLLAKKRFTDKKGITKHFVYSLFYRFNSN